jgi:hypothetical protein
MSAITPTLDGPSGVDPDYLRCHVWEVDDRFGKVRGGPLHRGCDLREGSLSKKPPCESKPYEGPIPRGEYSSDTRELSNPSPIGDIRRSLGNWADWGDWRVPVHPLPGTNTFGRKGFFLRGGMFPGSAGCVDAGGGLFGNENYRSDPTRPA